MRRLLVVCLVALLGLPLVAASPTSLFNKPAVIVYPFTANGSSIDREASSRLATIIATQLAQNGQISVVAPPPGTERKDYLNVARAHSADYYVAGFISPIGTGVSVVEQVVSATSGIVVYSTTAQIQTYADAAGQGDDLAAFITRHANRGLAAIGTAPPASSPTPAAAANEAAQTNLGKLFGRKKKPAATAKPAATTTAKPAATTTATTAPAAARTTTATPARTAAPAAAAAGSGIQTPPPRVAAPPPPPAAPATTAPRTVTATTAPRTAAATTAPQTVAAAASTNAAASYAILAVTGPAPEAAIATQRLIARTNGERADSASAACTGHAPHAVLAGTLTVRPDPTYGGSSATFDLHATDCAGKTLWHRSFTSDAGGSQSAQLATERAVESAIGAYLNPPRKR